jgi:hypothetical protein
MASRKLYVAALMEIDDDKMSGRIVEAEGAILARAKELLKAGDNTHEEEELMAGALLALNALRSYLPIRPESRSHAERFYQSYAREDSVQSLMPPPS